MAGIIDFIVLSTATGFLVGCLQTRANLKQENPTYTAPAIKSTTHTVEQNTKAESAAKNEDVNSEFRQLYGRLETVEAELKKSQDHEYVKGLETKLQQMDAKMTLLETTVADLNAKSKAAAAAAAVAASAPPKEEKKVGALENGDKAFEKKEWEDAILSYEDYRKKNPKGGDYAHATYRIGVSFQSMGLKDDARAFYKEVVDKFPKSKEADLAKSKLKKL